MRLAPLALVALAARAAAAQAPDSATAPSGASGGAPVVVARGPARPDTSRADGDVAPGPAPETGFDDRRRSKAGRFLTVADIAQRRPTVTSDLFTRISGVSWRPGATSADRQLAMRGPFGQCTPAVYLDGRYYDGMSAESVDTWARPNDVTGIEIYGESAVPTEFRRLSSRADRDELPCGSVVIWTR